MGTAHNSSLGQSHTRLRGLILIGLAGFNLFVLVGALVSLSVERQQYETQARLQTQGAVQSIDHGIATAVGRIDLALQAVGDNLQEQLQAKGRLDLQVLPELLQRYETRLPEVLALRVTDREGHFLAGKGMDVSPGINVSDRDYFEFLRTHPEAGMLVAKPRMGRLFPRMVVVFARRYETPGRGFAGVVTAILPLEYFSQQLASLAPGPEMVVALRDVDLGLVAMRPGLEGGPVREVGDRRVSAELQQRVDAGVKESTYYTADAVAGKVARIASFRRMRSIPMYALAGLDESIYLAPWKKEQRKTWIGVSAFILLSSLCAWGMLRLLRDMNRQHVRNQLYLRYASDSIHILDRQGYVVEASDRFCASLGLERQAVIGLHVSQWDALWSKEVLEQDVLPELFANTRSRVFETRHRRKDGTELDVEITCVPFELEGQSYMFAAARDVTERQRQESERKRNADLLRQSEERYRMLLKHVPAGILHYDENLIVSYTNDRFQEIMEVPSQYMLGLDCHKLKDASMVPVLSQALEQGDSHYEGPYTTSYSGKPLWLTMNCTALRDASGLVLGGIAIIEDVTQRKRMELQGQRQRDALIRLNEISSTLHLPLAEQLRLALDISARHLELEIGVIGHVEGSCYRVQAQVSPEGTLSDGQELPLADTCCALTLAEGRVLAISDMRQSTYRTHPCRQRMDVTAYIGAPVQRESQVYGTVSFASIKPYARKFDESDVEFMRLLARWVASTLERDGIYRQLQANERYLKTVIDSEPEAVTVVDRNMQVQQINRAGLLMLEAESVESLASKGLLSLVLPEYQQAYMALHEAVFSGQNGILEFRLKGLKGTERWLETHATPLYDDHGQVISCLSVTRDVSLLKGQQAELQFLAHYDSLTRLPNRSLLADRMLQGLAQARRAGTRVAVGYLDLDGFKAVNDTGGHEAGDCLLVEMGQRLQATVRQGDTVARLGGDEFALVLLGVDGDPDWQSVAQRVLQAVAEPVRLGVREYRVSGSLGISVFPDDNADPDTLLRHADHAMYRAKARGKNQVCVFSVHEDLLD